MRLAVVATHLSSCGTRCHAVAYTVPHDRVPAFAAPATPKMTGDAYDRGIGRAITPRVPRHDQPTPA